MRLRHIPLDHPKVVEALAHIPVGLHSRTYIAGSAAARWPEAWEAGGDVDMWVTQVNDEERERMVERHPPSTELDVLVSLATEIEVYAHAKISIMHAGQRLHIMRSSETIETILGGFDVSCHAAAVNVVSGMILLAPGFDTRVRVIQWRPGSAHQTLWRALKFGQRYLDPGVWTDARTQDCAREAFGMVREGL